MSKPTRIKRKTERADPYGASLEHFWRTGRGACHFIRDDGWENDDEPSWYFTSFAEFPAYEKRALKFARGRVLDLGCGPGRHALYLQRRGLHVVGLEASERVAAIARARGVRDVRVGSACEHLPFAANEFDTAILFGNNLGICGNRRATLRLLRAIHRVTRPHARILATTRAPNFTNPLHLNYWRKKKSRDEIGVVHLQLHFAGESQEMDLLWLAPEDLMMLARRAGWELTHVFTEGNLEQGYATVLEKLQ